ncbi:MAG: SRPBCC domain-containing protein [Leptospiraceae bacterium]|nr:SRPBCC domain-containing protein [Leptospiraceae bacterium]MCB1319033.1 SRPBCC domain-containing protein [Leptospiraceae bacterium]
MARPLISAKAPERTEEIQHSISVRASMIEVFEALTVPRIIDEWGGGPSRFQARTNGKWSLWDGEMSGTVKDVEFPRRLIYTLREEYWDDGILDSLVSFTLEEIPRGTLLILEHTGLPSRKIREIHNEGWCEYFLGPLKSYLER